MFANVVNDVASRVTQAIAEAARATGQGFEYLLRTARQESNFDPTLRASTSSATGLFQIIDQTWLQLVKEEGGAHGFGRLADGIERQNGRYVVADPALRREILELRQDPRANALMAGAFTRRNAAALTESLGRRPTEGELYVAHVMGAAGGRRLLDAADDAPGTSAPALFPEAAHANRAIFFTPEGRPRSVREVRDLLTERHARPIAGDLRRLGLSPDLVQSAQVPTSAAAPAATTPDAPIFRSLFQTDRPGPVSAALRSLWADPAPAGSPASPPAAQAPRPAESAGGLTVTNGPNGPRIVATGGLGRALGFAPSAPSAPAGPPRFFPTSRPRDVAQPAAESAPSAQPAASPALATAPAVIATPAAPVPAGAVPRAPAVAQSAELSAPPRPRSSGVGSPLDLSRFRRPDLVR